VLSLAAECVYSVCEGFDVWDFLLFFCCFHVVNEFIEALKEGVEPAVCVVRLFFEAGFPEVVIEAVEGSEGEVEF